MVPFHMRGETLSWFKWMHQNHLIIDWPSFTRSLELRFGPSSYTNHQAELFKLHQQTTVTDYQTRFEKLCNCVHGLSSETILNYFISGLNPETRRELAILSPYSIPQAIGLTKLIEDKIKDFKPKPTRPPAYTTVLNSINTHINRSQSTQPTPHTLPIKHLSLIQMQERKALGLCYNCDDKFLPGHKCSTSHFLPLLDDTEPVPEILHTPPDLDETEDMIHFHLSPHAITRNFSPQTLKFQGLIHNLPVTVLIDSGSSHNILQPHIAKHLHLPIQPSPPFRVMVGNDAFITCQGICPEVQISLQNSVFTIPFYLLPIEGANVVIGIEWLCTLGPIQPDFAIPSMAFTHLNKQITLTATNPPTPTQDTYHQLCHNISIHTIASLHLLSIDTHSMIPISLETRLQTPSSPLYQLPHSIQTILRKHRSIFKPPHGLPPLRPHDHHISLLPKTGPVNVRSYRYPHSQKHTITHLIAEMLQEGFIKPSTNPFSSSVLVIKKKYGTWCFCVDYRALNVVTMRDCFPIPTIDDLLDDLGSAPIFTKIDLYSGYHQIRLNPNDTHKTTFRTIDGHYEFLVMPFGLTNAPSTFQTTMNDLLRPFLRQFVLVFL